MTDSAARGLKIFQGKEEMWPGQYSDENYNNSKGSLFYCLGHLYFKLFLICEKFLALS